MPWHEQTSPRQQRPARSQRQLRVGELVRHALAEMLTRGDVHDPVIEGHLITVPEVRMTADLRLATVYVMPLGGRDAERGGRGARAQQEIPARRDRAARQPEIRARHPLPHRRAIRRSRADRQAVAHAGGAARSRTTRTTSDDDRERRCRIAEATQSRRSDRAASKPTVKREKRDVHGWVVLDKPVGMTSTHAVARRSSGCSRRKRAGHAGTLDPLASGALPIALGEATKTVPFVMDGRKLYRFTVRWGEERDTDDAEGRVVADQRRRARPRTRSARCCRRFTGTIEQVPPRFSAIKIEGERAYDLARDGETVELAARPVEIHRLELVEMPDADHAVFEAECGKGTYVRALARDIGRALGCFGHVSALRRVAVGPFGENDMISLEQLEALCHRAAAGEGSLADALTARRDRAGRHPGAGRQPGRCGKAATRPSRFVARTGRSHFPRHGLCDGGGPAAGPGRSGPRRDRPQARVQPGRPDRAAPAARKA